MKDTDWTLLRANGQNVSWPHAKEYPALPFTGLQMGLMGKLLTEVINQVRSILIYDIK